jgi:hypothetical protein
MDEASLRTVAFEVSMQNSGLASGIAVEMGRVASMGLAPPSIRVVDEDDRFVTGCLVTRPTTRDLCR